MDAVKGEEPEEEEEEDSDNQEEDDEDDDDDQDCQDNEPQDLEDLEMLGDAPKLESIGRHPSINIGADDMRGRSQGADSGNERLSPPSQSRPLSRSPPQSRSPSPNSVSKMMESLSISEQRRSGVKGIVSSDLSKQRSRQQKKYHSKRSTQRVGRPKGSKAKQDTRVKLDRSGVWE
jgi:RIO kinase 2